jgi:hypothetical protein
MRSIPSVFPLEKQAQNKNQYEQSDIDKQGYIRGCLDILIRVFGKIEPTVLQEFDQKVASEGLTEKDRSYYKYLISRQITEIGDSFRELEAYFKAS